MLEITAFIAITILSAGVGILYGQARAQRDTARFFEERYREVCGLYCELGEMYEEQARILREVIEDGDSLVDAGDEPVEVWLN